MMFWGVIVGLKFLDQKWPKMRFFQLLSKTSAWNLTWFLYEVKQHKGLKLNKIF